MAIFVLVGAVLMLLVREEAAELAVIWLALSTPFAALAWYFGVRAKQREQSLVVVRDVLLITALQLSARRSIRGVFVLGWLALVHWLIPLFIAALGSDYEGARVFFSVYSEAPAHVGAAVLGLERLAVFLLLRRCYRWRVAAIQRMS
jgi:hypothetical protein